MKRTIEIKLDPVQKSHVEFILEDLCKCGDLLDKDIYVKQKYSKVEALAIVTPSVYYGIFKIFPQLNELAEIFSEDEQLVFFIDKLKEGWKSLDCDYDMFIPDHYRLENIYQWLARTVDEVIQILAWNEK